MPVLMEVIRPFGRGSKPVEVDVLGPNPLVAYVIAAYDGSPYGGEPPTMFYSGDRPPFLASGESPDVLRRVRFELRHSAAMTESRRVLLELVEVSADPEADPEAVMTPEGRGAFNAYREKVFRWATAGPPEQTSFTSEDLDRLFAGQS